MYIYGLLEKSDCFWSCQLQKLGKITFFIGSVFILLHRNFVRNLESFFKIIFNILLCISFKGYIDPTIEPEEFLVMKKGTIGHTRKRFSQSLCDMTKRFWRKHCTLITFYMIFDWDYRMSFFVCNVIAFYSIFDTFTRTGAGVAIRVGGFRIARP